MLLEFALIRYIGIQMANLRPPHLGIHEEMLVSTMLSPHY